MHIIPSEIEKYCKKSGYDIYMEIDPTDKEVVFRIIRGTFEQRGSIAVYLTGQEMLDILNLNKVLGNDGEIKKVLHSDDRNKDDEIHDLIYDLLAKYITQMTSAAMGKDFFPEIKSLPQHEKDYFSR